MVFICWFQKNSTSIGGMLLFHNLTVFFKASNIYCGTGSRDCDSKNRSERSIGSKFTFFWNWFWDFPTNANGESIALWNSKIIFFLGYSLLKNANFRYQNGAIRYLWMTKCYCGFYVGWLVGWLVFCFCFVSSPYWSSNKLVSILLYP